jgi:hypothetical protein
MRLGAGGATKECKKKYDIREGREEGSRMGWTYERWNMEIPT